MSKPISRRTVLRGMAATIALPMLEINPLSPLSDLLNSSSKRPTPKANS
jgi:hypothetical protein